MEYLFTLDSLISLITLAALEIVLGIDNVIFVSILMTRLDKKGKAEGTQNMDDRGYCSQNRIAPDIGLAGH